MGMRAYAYSNQGGREHNEDSVRCAVWGDRGLFVVCDGLGGHQCGEVASAIAADAIFDGCAALMEMDSAAMQAQMSAANAAVLRGQQEPGRGEMKTTAAVLSLMGESAVWAHAGDSRIYRFSGSELAWVTRDHSVTYMKYLGGEISYMDIYHDDDRCRLLRVMGKPSCQSEAGQGTVQSGDAFLLCTDGFWEYVYQEEMLADLIKSESPEQWVELMLLRRIRRAGPGSDNFTAVAVFMEG